MLQHWLDKAWAAWLTYGMDWAVFGLYLLITFLVAWAGRRIARSLLPLLTRRTNTALDDRMVAAAARPVRLAILAMGLRISLQALQGRIPAFQEKGAYVQQFGWALLIAEALVILGMAALANGLLKAAMDWYIHDLAKKSQGNWDRELLPLFRKILSLLVYFIAASIIFDRFGYPLTALITTAGVASLAVALAAQETLSNMLGGLTILVDRPFRIGDTIELADGKSGDVVEIGLRSTKIKQFDGNALVVPNKDMANSRVINFALPHPRAAIRQTITVALNTDIEQAKALLLQTMKAHAEVLADPEPGVWFTRFTPNGLELFMACWVNSYKDRFRITDELNVWILKAMRQANIKLGFPQSDVHLSIQDAGQQEFGQEIRREMGKHTNQA